MITLIHGLYVAERLQAVLNIPLCMGTTLLPSSLIDKSMVSDAFCVNFDRRKVIFAPDSLLIRPSDLISFSSPLRQRLSFPLLTSDSEKRQLSLHYLRFYSAYWGAISTQLQHQWVCALHRISLGEERGYVAVHKRNLPDTPARP